MREATTSRRPWPGLLALVLFGAASLAEAAPGPKCEVCVTNRKGVKQTKTVGCNRVPRLLERGATEGPCTDEPDTCSNRSQLAGRSIASYPLFEYARAFKEDEGIELAVDPNRFPAIAGQTCDVYVTAPKTEDQWCADGALVDVRGAPDVRSFVAGSIQDNTFPLVGAFGLSADAGDGLGVGYDVVLDCDMDGSLGADDYIDGLGDEPGLHVVHDLLAAGPHATSTFDEIGPLPPWPGPWTGEGDDLRVWYPADLDDPGFVGTFPLIVVSHGNGHRFSWYDFLMDHLASYGYVVMSHDNKTVEGIETASGSTLHFTDRIIDEQATLGGGVLDGHVDAARIVWIGHSRGGEGVVRAFDRLIDEGFNPAHFDASDILLIQSIAPTDFLGGSGSDPHDANYALLYGSADGDVTGCASSDVAQSFNVYERGTGNKSSHYLQGASHNDFNECGMGLNDGTGPDLVGCPEAQRVQLANTLALVQRYEKGSLAAKDFLWRQYESFRPSAVASTTVVVNDYKDADSSGNYVIDDFQSGAGERKSSSGARLSANVDNYDEDVLDDFDGGFSWNGFDVMNGMTRANTTGAEPDDQKGCVFDYTSAADMTYSPARGDEDWSGYEYLSLRACQGTRHPETTAELGDLTFTVTLADGSGHSASINIGAYGGGIEEPYQRTGCNSGGGGTGWANEFEVIRIRLGDFLTDGSGVDLADVDELRLEFGPASGSSRGRLGLDDIQLTTD